jgi:hypothetical protein
MVRAGILALRAGTMKETYKRSKLKAQDVSSVKN